MARDDDEEEDAETATWINEEAAKLNKAGIAAGSAREDDMLATWRRVRPEMCLRMGDLLPKLAFVLDMKCLEARKRYVRAGMPPSDAHLEATREWLLLEPEEPEDPYGRLPDADMSATVAYAEYAEKKYGPAVPLPLDCPQAESTATPEPERDARFTQARLTGPKAARLTINLPAELHGRFKAACALKGAKMVDEVTRLIEEWTEKTDRPPAACPQ